MEFYSVTHNSFEKRGFPWISEVTSPLPRVKKCQMCGTEIQEPKGKILVRLEKNKGIKWSDTLGSGDIPLFILSEKALDAFLSSGIRLPARAINDLHIETPLPRKMSHLKIPEYVWINGEHLKGAKLNLSGSGFVGARTCKGCGCVNFNFSATYDKRNLKVHPYRFFQGTWQGLDLFTTNLSSNIFFCTQKFVDVASSNKLTNFRFQPIAQGRNADFLGMQY